MVYTITLPVCFSFLLNTITLGQQSNNQTMPYELYKKAKFILAASFRYLLAKRILLPIALLFYFLVINTCTFGQSKKDEYWIRVVDSTTDQYGYEDRSGKMAIPFGKYSIIYTELFKTHAIVFKEGEGFVAIDRSEKILYHIFPFDNGPDEPSEGLYRIIENGKIGYANMKGEIVIAPQFACARPFKKGKAEVSVNCTTHKDGEHSFWVSEEWYYINKKGKKLSDLK